MPAGAASAPELGVRLAGGDISWPNCPKGMGIPSRRSMGLPMPRSAADFVVVGLTNGPGFHPNPCLADQVAWAKGSGVWTGAYAMTTFPTRSERVAYGGGGPWPTLTRNGRLRNTGYQQATFNVVSMRSAGLDVPFVWVDVEPYPTHPWSRSHRANRAVVAGAVRGYEDNGFRVGFYSYDLGWRTVVGGWRKPSYPAWVPVGPSAYGWTEASGRCHRRSFSGGPVLLAQWVDGDRDRDLTCARLVGRPARPHPLATWLGTSLSRGDSGRAVSDLQRALHMRPDHRSGRFDARTQRVLLAFQRIRAFPLTGVATDVEMLALGAATVRPERPTRLPEFFTAY